VPRKGFGGFLSTFILVILAVSSTISLNPQLTRKNWQTDIPSVRLLTNTIKNEITTRYLKNNNLAVLASPDNNVYGRRYRDVLLVNDFVISIADEKTVRFDQAYEMNFFRNGELMSKWSWPNSEWSLYLFNKNSR
jgi:hypothetical protein